ncbi:hypothetical protein CRUP_013804 [Coryphaenoides rupestris]|nr:hypothetical protein CRUP_013804 [Coryphaenoides rupestris]
MLNQHWNGEEEEVVEAEVVVVWSSPLVDGGLGSCGGVGSAGRVQLVNKRLTDRRGESWLQLWPPGALDLSMLCAYLTYAKQA